MKVRCKDGFYIASFMLLVLCFFKVCCQLSTNPVIFPSDFCKCHSKRKQANESQEHVSVHHLTRPFTPVYLRVLQKIKAERIPHFAKAQSPIEAEE